MTKMAAMPIYGKNPSKSFLRNWLTDFNETWHEVLMAQVLQRKRKEMHSRTEYFKMILIKIGPQELICPHPVALYMYIP